GRAALATVLTSPVMGALAMAPLRVAGGRHALARLARRAPAWARPWLALAAAAPPRSREAPLPAVVEAEGTCRGTAVLLEGCAPSRLFSATLAATARLLGRAGVRVMVPRVRTCCGALAL